MNAHVSQGGWPVLVLNADFRPLSYYPLSLWSWQDAIKAVFLDRVNIVEHYDRAVQKSELRDAVAERRLLKSFVKPTTPPGLHPLQRLPARPLRLPVLRLAARTSPSITSSRASKGGHTTWENVVAACSPCNLRKGNLTPQQARMFPRQRALSRRRVHQLHRNGRLFPPNYLHDSWLDYLYWDTELDP